MQGRLVIGKDPREQELGSSRQDARLYRWGCRRESFTHVSKSLVNPTRLRNGELATYLRGWGA